MDPHTGCWNWVGYAKGGYGAVQFHGRGWVTSRLSWAAHNGPIPKGLRVLHHCDNPRCIRPDHLFLGTHADNMEDMKRKGRSTLGETNPSAKLTERAVRFIRSHPEMKSKHLAEMFGVHGTVINGVRKGKTWKHVK